MTFNVQPGAIQMTQLIPIERRQLGLLSELTHCNPFEPRRIELEQQVLGNQFVEENVNAWSRTEATDRQERPNVVRINEWAGTLLEELRKRQLTQGALQQSDVALYDDLATYHLYYQHLAPMGRNLLAFTGESERLANVWRAFRAERRKLLEPLGAIVETLASDAHLFAGLHQIRRAFTNIFTFLIGESAPATRLRASVWQSLFTHDLRRYRRTLYSRMNELATLITGPSGSGKELIAQAIGRSQFVPFDPERERFLIAAGNAEPFIAVNLAALSPTLIESELFGHRKGAFTGAIADHVGWLERCAPTGAVFLDEIGELDLALQVKLLRVTQSRDYSRLGESTPRRFAGKLIAATNRDLAAEMRADRFREDLYYRLCSDCVQAPALREQLVDRPAALAGLVRYLARKVLGDLLADDSEVEPLATEVETWIATRLPADYAWPGNIRELEQCVRSVLVRREYQPPSSTPSAPRPDWLTAAERGELSVNQLLGHYCRQVYDQTGSYEGAARVLGLDRRTVKSHVETAK